MTEILPIQLESSRIRLRSAIDGDAEVLFKTYFGLIAPSRFLSRHPHGSVDQTDKFLKQWTCDAWEVWGEPFAWVIATLEESSPVGIFLAFPKGEILKGWSVLPAFGEQPRDAIYYSKIKITLR